MSDIILQMYLGLGLLGLMLAWGLFEGLEKQNLQSQAVPKEKLGQGDQ